MTRVTMNSSEFDIDERGIRYQRWNGIIMPLRSFLDMLVYEDHRNGTDNMARLEGVLGEHGLEWDTLMAGCLADDYDVTEKLLSRWITSTGNIMDVIKRDAYENPQKYTAARFANSSRRIRERIAEKVMTTEHMSVMGEFKRIYGDIICEMHSRIFASKSAKDYAAETVLFHYSLHGMLVRLIETRCMMTEDEVAEAERTGFRFGRPAASLDNGP